MDLVDHSGYGRFFARVAYVVPVSLEYYLKIYHDEDEERDQSVVTLTLEL